MVKWSKQQQQIIQSKILDLGFLFVIPYTHWMKHVLRKPSPLKDCHVLQVKELIIGDNFKPNSAFIILDFLIRHSFITPDTGLYTQVKSYTGESLF